MKESVSESFYKEFFDRALMGEKVARVLLIYRYISRDYELPDYYNKYIERFILNVADEIGYGNGIPARLCPDNPNKSSSFYRCFEVSEFVYRKVKNEERTIP